jgi:DNA/RNA-binding domain of Phe-tRNA-synthetase-like protein
MPEQTSLTEFLRGAAIDPAVSALRPDYRVALIAADGLEPAASDDDDADRLLAAAESSAREQLQRQPVEELPHTAAWRDAYRAFGARPQRTRNSLEALLRRVDDGLPRVNRLTDIYNALSVLHRVPIGGEDLARYSGAPRLVRASGDEEFDTAVAGESVVEHPEAGEVVWRDDLGVTCRRWNWRQCRRTQLTETTTSALFILDALGPLSDEALEEASDDLAAHLARLGSEVRIARRTIGAAEHP